MPTFSAQRGLARNYLTPLINQGFNASQAHNMLQSLDLGYRRQDFLRDWKEFSRLSELKETFKYIPKDKKPTMGTITSTEESLTKEYSYIFDVKGKDSVTGREKFIHWRLATDDLMTLAEAEEAIQPYLEDPEYAVSIKDYEVKVIGVKQSISLL